MAICEQLPLLHIVILYNSNAREPISGEKETLTSIVKVEVSGYVGKQNSADIYVDVRVVRNQQKDK